jgi:hypothetical protein
MEETVVTTLTGHAATNLPGFPQTSEAPVANLGRKIYVLRATVSLGAAGSGLLVGPVERRMPPAKRRH